MLTKTQLEKAAAERGTTNQRERFVAGLLTEDELVMLAHPIVFRLFESFERWSTSKVQTAVLLGFRHRGECRSRLDITHDPITAMTAEEWRVFGEITRAASLTAAFPEVGIPGSSLPPVDVTPTRHRWACPACKQAVDRASAKVTIHWAGRELVREYKLS
jgi:hypothetical protein